MVEGGVSDVEVRVDAVQLVEQALLDPADCYRAGDGRVAVGVFYRVTVRVDDLALHVLVGDDAENAFVCKRPVHAYQSDSVQAGASGCDDGSCVDVRSVFHSQAENVRVAFHRKVLHFAVVDDFQRSDSGGKFYLLQVAALREYDGRDCAAGCIYLFDHVAV